jgi:hypothetical protein
MRIYSIQVALVVFSCMFADVCPAQEPTGKATFSTNAAHEVIATLDGDVAQCGFTALPEEPTFRISNRTIEVTQPVAGIACMANVAQGSMRAYHATVNLGHLATGTYTVTWSFPKVTTTYTVSP